MMFSAGMLGDVDLRWEVGTGAVARRLEGTEDARGVSRGKESLEGGSAGVVMSVSKNGCVGVDNLGMGAIRVRGFFETSGSGCGAGRLGICLSLSSSGLRRVTYRSLHCSGLRFMDTCYISLLLTRGGITVRATRSQNSGFSGSAPGCLTTLRMISSCSLVNPKLCLLGGEVCSSTGERPESTLTHLFLHDCDVCCGF